jgi:hypothetical protein
MHNILTPDTVSTMPSPAAFESKTSSDLARFVSAATGLTMDIMGLPFDLTRAHYARAVQLGLIERSMLASRDFSRTIGALEQLTLGAWARRI